MLTSVMDNKQYAARVKLYNGLSLCKRLAFILSRIDSKLSLWRFQEEQKEEEGAESEEQEWDEVVKGAEAESECTAEPVRCEHGEQHGEQAHDGEVHLHRDWENIRITF